MKKARILVVENETIIATEIEAHLQSLGYEVTSIVDTGEKAVEKAESDRPDLVLMDIRSKGDMDGIDAADMIRSKLNIPIVFLIADPDAQKIEQAKTAMPFGYLLKPIRKMDLKVTIEMALHVADADNERRKAEEELRNEKLLTEEYIDSLPGLFYVFDEEKFVKWNQRWEMVTGYSADELSKMYGRDFFHGSDKETIGERMSEVFVDGVAEVEAEFVTKGGRVIPHYFSGVRKIIDGRPHLIGLGIDSTRRKQAEEAQRESEYSFTQLFEQSTISTCLYDSDGTCIRVNPAFCRLFAVEAESFTNGQYNVFKDQAFIDAGIVPLLKEIFEEKKTVRWELNVKVKTASASAGTPASKEGKTYYQAVGFPIVDSTGDLKYVAVQHHDITVHKQSAEEIRQLSQFQESIIDNANIWLNVLDENANVVIWNKAAEKISGYSREEVYGRADIWEWFYPDEKYRQEITLKATSIIEGEEIQDFETTITCKDGSIKTMTWYSRNLLDDEGNIVGSIALGVDVSDRRKAENETQKLIKSLQDALEQVRQLKGLLPICAKCKKIRDDKGYWNQIESYIEKHTEALFSHGVCPDCAEKLYGDTSWYKKMKWKRKE